ncbi:MAG: N-6 DNA methylase [bacterium]
MDKQQAQNIIKETFENPFDKDRFTGFVKNLLNQIDDSHFAYYGKFIPDAYKLFIGRYERIGKYSDSENRIDILIVYLNKEASIERARTRQRNFIAGYLEGNYGSDISKDAALVAFVSPNENDWRFSLVKMDYKFEQTESGKMKVKEEFSPARRWSFLVGKNESSHTAQSRLVPILTDDQHNPSLAQLEEAFNIEKVTKEFFEKYRDLFLRTKETLDEIVKQDSKIKADFEIKSVDTVNFAKKLLGQIVFLYFLQKKGWFGVERDAEWGTGAKHFLRELFSRRDEFPKGGNGKHSNFFNDILEPLFYEALRIDRRHDDDYYKYFNCKIPFLNGGLFDPINNYDWVHTDILLPNELFSNRTKTKEGDTGHGILDIFDRYNFTVKEDEPLEKEVAIDPEMLGKVFENLLEVKDRKSKGTYYTPREIVHYMCQQSLINYLYTELNKGVTAYQKIGDIQTDAFGNEVKTGQFDLIAEHKSSPQISKEDLETLIKYGEQVGENEAIVEARGKETDTYSYKLPESIRNNAKLIDEKLTSIKVCDPAIGSGAFPVGMMHEIVKTRNVLSAYINNKGLQPLATHESHRTIYNFKRQCIEHSLYGVDIDPGAVEIAKLRLWLSLVVDEEDIKQIKPLPNLDYKIVCGNSLLGVEKNLFNDQLFAELERLKPIYFDETNPTKKQEYKQQIDDLISEITNGHAEFDFEVYFSEVFHEKKGFDVVIANPPYIKEYVNRKAFDGLRDLPYYQGKMDLWYLFACRGIDVSRNDSGVVTFIAQNNWVTSHGASKMRNKVIKDAQILSLIDFNDFKIFEAGIQTMVMMFKKNTDLDSYSFDYRRLRGNGLDINDVISLLNKEDNVKAEYLTPTIARNNFIDKTLTFSSSDIEQILEKISSKANFRLSNDEVANGIHHHHDRVDKKRKEILGDQYKVGDGIFVLSDEEKKRIPFTKKELSLIKPSYSTKDLLRWYRNSINQEWVIYTDSSFKDKKQIESYPNIKKHLDQFKKVITSDNKPYGLHRARNEYFFKGEKIIAVRKCALPTFTYVDFDSYVSATFYVIKTGRVNQKYLTGVLNSKLITFWFKHKGKMQGTNFQIDKEPILALPLLQTDQTSQNTIAYIVAKILTITKDNDYLQNPQKQAQAQVKELEREIDRMVYQLYSLTPDEINIVEGENE